MDEERLLELLEEDGQLSSKELASMLDSSEKEVEEAIKDLKQKGVLKKFKAVVDWKKMDGRHSASIIQVNVVPQEQLGFDRICREIAKDDRVLDVHLVTGEYDLMVLVKGETMDDISDFVTEVLAPKKEVLGTYTHIILDTFKREGAVFKEDEQKRLKVTP